MSPEEFTSRVRQLVRQRSAALTEKQVDEITAALVESEKASSYPLWTYSSETLIAEYTGHAIDSLQRNEPHRFAVRPTPDQYVERMVQAGATLSPEERITLARTVADLDTQTMLERYASMEKAISARKPEPQPESAIARYQMKLRADEQKRIAANRAVHTDVERMRGVDFDKMSPEARLNIARRAK